MILAQVEDDAIALREVLGIIGDIIPPKFDDLCAFNDVFECRLCLFDERRDLVEVIVQAVAIEFSVQHQIRMLQK